MKNAKNVQGVGGLGRGRVGFGGSGWISGWGDGVGEGVKVDVDEEVKFL